MGKIRSALEIALERTESVKSDRGSIGQFEAKQKGKKLANEFLENGTEARDREPGDLKPGDMKSLGEVIKKTPENERESFKQGLFDVFISQITLPIVKDDLVRIENAGRGLVVVIGERQFGDIIVQMGQVLSQYLDEAAQYEEAIKRQYAPKLRQKEEEIARRLGREIKLDPFQDPEFVAFFNQNMNALKENYEPAVGQVKEEAKRLFEGE